MRWKGTKLGEGCPKVRLSQDRMTILSFHLAYYEGKGTKLGEGIQDFYIRDFTIFGIRDFYIRDYFIREKFVAPSLC